MPEEMQNQQPNMPTTMNPANPAPKPTAKSNIMPLVVILTIVIVVVAVFIAWKLFTNKSETPTPPPATTSNDVPAVQNVADLDKLETELNNTSLADLEKDLNQNDTDASEF